MDLILAFVLLVILFPVLILVTIFLKIELGSPIFIQERLGVNMQPFNLYKFRTMKIGTPSISTHNVSNLSLTKSGGFLRKTKLDELPQLFNVIFGQMSLVGPRPCLPNQSQVIKHRLQNNVFDVRPGITGISQLQKIDMSKPEKLALTDSYMIQNFNINIYLFCIINTALGKGAGDRINIEN